MPQYMLALYDDPSRWPKLSPEEMQRSIEKYMAWGKRPYVVQGKRLAGDNGPARFASFASEAGQFQNAGLPAVLCGPGSIDQAHQPDEYVDVSQMERGAAFMARLIEALTS